MKSSAWLDCLTCLHQRQCTLSWTLFFWGGGGVAEKTYDLPITVGNVIVHKDNDAFLGDASFANNLVSMAHVSLEKVEI